jgi:hypothetical protein
MRAFCMRHLSHYLLVAKGLLLVAGLIAFALSGASVELANMLNNRFSGSLFAVVPVYWSLLFGGWLLMAFPLTLAEEHYARVRGTMDEETPFWHWLQWFGIELLIILVVGGIVSAAMILSPLLWWLYLTVVWLAYCHIAPRLQLMTIMAMSDDEQADRRPELVADLKAPLAAAGFELEEVRILPDEDDLPNIPPDAYLAKHGNKYILYFPSEWAAMWTVPEMIAVALHKIVMDGKKFQNIRNVMRFAQALAGFGGFAIIYGFLARAGLVVSPGHVTTIPYLLAWIIVASVAYHPLECFLNKRWVLRADDEVIKWMENAEGLKTALERAEQENEKEDEAPALIEKYFTYFPSIKHRLERLKNNP